MKKNAIKSLLLVVFLFPANCYLLAQNNTGEVLKYLQKEMKEQKIPGLQVAVVRNNEIVLSKALGSANVPFSVKADKNTIFSINSIAKVFTSVAIMQLVENKGLQISEPISNYVEGLPQNWGQITIQQLLSHTSGLPDIEDPISGGLIGEKGQDSAWAMVKKMPLRFKAGRNLTIMPQTIYYCKNLLRNTAKALLRNSFKKINLKLRE